MACTNVLSPPLMTQNTPGPNDEAITSEAEFDVALEALLRAAYSNDVTPNGSWVVRNGDPLPNWEVQIHDLV